MDAGQDVGGQHGLLRRGVERLAESVEQGGDGLVGRDEALRVAGQRQFPQDAGPDLDDAALDGKDAQVVGVMLDVSGLGQAADQRVPVRDGRSGDVGVADGGPGAEGLSGLGPVDRVVGLEELVEGVERAGGGGTVGLNRDEPRGRVHFRIVALVLALLLTGGASAQRQGDAGSP